MRPGERPSELVDLQGAWRREGRTLASDPPSEVADVLWLQVGRHFCDLRTPRARTRSTHVLDQPQAFSGTVRLEGGAISFHHDLDSLARDPAHPDEGTVHRKGDVMYERGEGFEETWVVASLPGDDVGLAELRPSEHAGGPPGARLLRVGSVMLAVWGGETPGGAQFTRSDGWARDRSLHEHDPTMGIDEAAQRMGTGQPLPHPWVTIEPEEV
jgi:hypothetical protein